MAAEKSPAVVALEQEQAAQRGSHRKSELDAGLEGTFPASDPVSSTITAIPTGSADTAALALSGDAVISSDAPLVDEALEALGSSDDASELVGSASEELAALRLEIGRLRESAVEIGGGSLRVAKAQAGELVDDTRDRIRSRPLAAIGVAALIGYVWGMTR